MTDSHRISTALSYQDQPISMTERDPKGYLRRESPFSRYLMTQRGLSQATVNIYRREVDGWILAGEPDLSKWIADCGGAPSTVTRRLSALKAWAKHKRDKELLAEVVDQERPKRPRGLPQPIEDVSAVMGKLDSLGRWVLTFLLETGLRISEAESVKGALPPPDVLRVLGKGSKERRVPLTLEAKEALLALGGSGTGGLKARAIQRRFQKAGIHPHQARHSRATSLVAAGVDIGRVSKILGHASPSTTMIYAQYDVQGLADAMETARPSNRRSIDSEVSEAQEPAS